MTVDDDEADEELDAVTCWVEYRWTCPQCCEVNDEGDVEPSGETQCSECGAVALVVGTV
ncbi:hypothetical protein [Microbacterium sp. SORGH_AS_0862]|uniref:hypothetical protein n=1 Tax=Microbacterium sp. SORGH_AS_0862 TaxID=3041789 RepID=UPI002793C8A6|nr:hypothetical protein [Microbacterium sp. SORGH_AS_0862]MDQ1205053.1 hypothetical protein [Microbacterium sp. SORGH_AS_0862]